MLLKKGAMLIWRGAMLREMAAMLMKKGAMLMERAAMLSTFKTITGGLSLIMAYSIGIQAYKIIALG